MDGFFFERVFELVFERVSWQETLALSELLFHGKSLVLNEKFQYPWFSQHPPVVSLSRCIVIWIYIPDHVHQLLGQFCYILGCCGHGTLNLWPMVINSSWAAHHKILAPESIRTIDIPMPIKMQINPKRGSSAVIRPNSHKHNMESMANGMLQRSPNGWGLVDSVNGGKNETIKIYWLDKVKLCEEWYRTKWKMAKVRQI